MQEKIAHFSFTHENARKQVVFFHSAAKGLKNNIKNKNNRVEDVVYKLDTNRVNTCNSEAK